jgi:hypothetical protein
LGAPYFIVGDLYGPPGSASTSVHLDNVVIDLQ